LELELTEIIVYSAALLVLQILIITLYQKQLPDECFHQRLQDRWSTVIPCWHTEYLFRLHAPTGTVVAGSNCFKLHSSNTATVELLQQSKARMHVSNYWFSWGF